MPAHFVPSHPAHFYALWANKSLVTYEEFAPLAFQILVEVASADFFDAPMEQDGLEDYLNEVFEPQTDSHGRISHAAAEEALLGADLGLTRIQALSCLAECDSWDKHSRAKLEDLLNPAAGMVLQLFQDWGYLGN